MTLLLSPAAFHRLVNAKKAWTDLLDITTFLHNHGHGLTSSVMLFFFMFSCWFLVPQFYRLSTVGKFE
ncbi:MAG: hypothetical protein K2W95_10595 [Candidatus Obscuribacterales bacterium]|nr:hypothetical protein [Candidatus Obscuribacterales bacterium]